NINTSKTIGGIGAFLMFISCFFAVFIAIPLITPAMMLIGAAMVLVGLYGLSTHYRKPIIFKKSIIGTIICIIGIALAVVIVYALIIPNVTTMMNNLFPNWDGNLNALPDLDTIDQMQLLESASSLLKSGFLMLGVLCVFITIATIFIRQSLKQLKEQTNVGLFETTGILLIIGGVLSIILIGYILLWISAVLLAIAFFQTRNQEPNINTYDQYQQSMPTTTI
ncbi:MAG: DUF996 domain-containing protein, partial [Candidatus Bathyarchaeota archaeon]|nr:DUF996 domain-containing protein [Candidatus Termiticorpusculum sp.]